MIQRSTGNPPNLNAVIATTQSHLIDLNGLSGVSVQVTASDVAPAAKTFASLTAGNITANTITIEAHGYITGTKIALTTGGSLPAGLSATNYWVIKVDADTLKLATSLANAVAGTAVDITGDGSGILTAAAASGNIFRLQKSNNGTTWVNLYESVTINTFAVNKIFGVNCSGYRYLKLLYTPSAGQITLAVSVTSII